MNEKQRARYEANQKWWNDRILAAQEQIVEKSTKQIQEQLIKYYSDTLELTKGRYLNTYNKLLRTIGAGREPTPADLYKLDAYWQMSAQIRDELTKLGEKEIAYLNKQFLDVWQDLYNNLAMKDDTNFHHIDTNIVQQMINQIWCADGKTWSQRIWYNTNKLQEALNEGLIECVVTGASPRNLKDMLITEFNVSYNNADMLVRTEIAHIQTQSTQKRYEDAGIREVYVWADKDERRCDICGKLHEKRFLIGEQMPVPAHPRCRCRILPVIE